MSPDQSTSQYMPEFKLLFALIRIQEKTQSSQKEEHYRVESGKLRFHTQDF